MNRLSRILIATFLLLSHDVFAYSQSGNPCTDPNATVLFASGVTSGTSGVKIVSGVTGQQIFVCSMAVEAVSGSSTPTFSLTGYNTANSGGCATAGGSSVVFYALSTVSTNFYPFNSPVAVAASGSGLCYLDGGTSPVQDYWLSYIQQ